MEFSITFVYLQLKFCQIIKIETIIKEINNFLVFNSDTAFGFIFT